MHGLIFEEIRRYAEDRLGPGGWTTLLDRAGLSSKAYDQVQAYPEADALQLVTAASHITGLPAAAVLEDFGEFVAPDLLRLSAPLVNRAWKTLDLLENTEETIHRVVRLDNPGAEPPALHVTRTGPRRVVIVYSSPQKMCALAKGICKGVAKHYHEAIALSESRCMHTANASVTSKSNCNEYHVSDIRPRRNRRQRRYPRPHQAGALRSTDEDRVELLLAGKVRFYLDTTEVPSSEALNSLKRGN